MRSKTSKDFRKALRQLSPQAREQARRAYQLFRDNPHHPSLRFKPVHAQLPVYSVRVGRSYRAIGVVEDDVIVWIWIGTHNEYDKYLSQL